MHSSSLHFGIAVTVQSPNVPFVASHVLRFIASCASKCLSWVCRLPHGASKSTKSTHGNISDRTNSGTQGHLGQGPSIPGAFLSCDSFHHRFNRKHCLRWCEIPSHKDMQTRACLCGVGCGVWGVGCGVWGVGCGVWGVGCGVWCGAWCLGAYARARVSHLCVCVRARVCPWVVGSLVSLTLCVCPLACVTQCILYCSTASCAVTKSLAVVAVPS